MSFMFNFKPGDHVVHIKRLDEASAQAVYLDDRGNALRYEKLEDPSDEKSRKELSAMAEEAGANSSKPMDLVVEGRHYVIESASLFAFDQGFGACLKTSMPRSRGLGEFAGCRIFASPLASVVVFIAGPSATRLIRGIREANLARQLGSIAPRPKP